LTNQTPPTIESRGIYYRAVRRLHLLAGLAVAPFVIILSITGAIYLFDREIDHWLNRNYIEVLPDKLQIKTLKDQEQAIVAAYPDAKIKSLVLPANTHQTSVWLIQSAIDGKEIRQRVYLDPYRLQITGVINPDSQFIGIVRDLHGNLLSGSWGSYLVEWASCWTIVMLITGIYLWWPQAWRWSGVLLPRMHLYRKNSNSTRAFWRDWHAIPSLVNVIFVAFIIFSGLPWSAFWGQQFAKLGEVIPWAEASPNFKSHPDLQQLSQHANHKPAEQAMSWVVQQIDKPVVQHHNHRDIEKLVVHLQKLPTDIYGSGVRIFYPENAQDVFVVNYVPDKAQGQISLYVDPSSGELLNSVDWKDYSPVAKAVEWGVMTHVGRQYGTLNQWFNFVACLVLIVTSLLGVYLWWKKTSSTKLRAEDKLPGFIKGLSLIFGIIFPLVGVTLLLAIAWNRGKNFFTSASPAN
jgi:uncharacterized iron-regulated membrane protein